MSRIAAATQVPRSRRATDLPAPFALLYDLPELKTANDQLWSEIRRRLARRGWSAPATLSRGSPDWNATLIGQTCGYRYMKELARRVEPIATPRYRSPGADGAFLRSALLVRTFDPASGLADLRGRRLSYDLSDRNSANLLRAELAPLAGASRYFKALVPAESFMGAVDSLLEGNVDATLIDAVALAHLQRLRPTAARALRLLLWTTRSPGPPLVVSNRLGLGLCGALVAALKEIEREPGLRDLRSELLIDGFTALPKAEYRAVLHLEQIAQSQGYPILR